MPATAGRVRMPANNRVHSSAALQTHGIWQSAIGYDPYAPTAKDSSKPSSDDRSAKPSAEDTDNAYTSFQGLLALARITGTTTDETRGACKKCGRVGHLTFQCRNFLSVKDVDAEKDELAAENAAAVFNKIKKSIGKNDQSFSEEEEEEESDSSDSDVDPEMEKIISSRFGKKVKKSDRPDSRDGEKRSSHRRGRSKRRNGKQSSCSDDDEDEEEERKEKRRCRKRSHRGSDDDGKEGSHRHRKTKKERKRRRSHLRSDDSDDDEDKSDRESNRKRHHKKHHHKRKDESETDSDSNDRSDRHQEHRSDRHNEHRRRRKVASLSEPESTASDEDGAGATRDRKWSKNKYKSVTRD